MLKEPEPSPYDVLEVPETAKFREIKKTYYRLAKKYHPDKKGSERDEAKLAQVNKAYEEIGSRRRRREYHEKLEGKARSLQPDQAGGGRGGLLDRGSARGVLRPGSPA